MQDRLMLLLVGGAILFAGCARPSAMDADGRFVGLARGYIEKYLRMFPETATALGDHRYDDRLNDYSLAGVNAAIELNRAYLDSLGSIDPVALEGGNRVDYHILKNQLEESVFRLEILREYEWNPLLYNIGDAINNLLARDFAPIEERLADVKSRLEMVPRVAALAKANINTPPRIHTETAILRNEGTISLIRDGLNEFVAQSPALAADLKEARERAVAALEYFGSWMEHDLLPESDGDFRLGEEKFRRKLHFTLQSDIQMEEILRRAEEDLRSTQDAMYGIALPLYERHFPGKPPSGSPDERKAVIKAVLDRLSDDRPTNESIVERARKCLESSTRFVSEKDIVRVPVDPVQLIVMPEFKRGVAVAYCDSPGPLEPNEKTFLAISPTPKDWPEERVVSFFREYNDYLVEDLVIHEAMPGHYLQLSHANRLEAPTLVRAVFSSGPFVEGWATYAEQVMVRAGYGGPEVAMQQLKMRLRMIINAIIDQKIHAGGMTEAEALALMMNEGFQEEGEAKGKWRRACLTSTQLSTYYVGNLEINAIRDAYEARLGSRFEMREFHDTLLSFGSPPPKLVRELMGL
jgi:hypothetical protein